MFGKMSLSTDMKPIGTVIGFCNINVKNTKYTIIYFIMKSLKLFMTFVI